MPSCVREYSTAIAFDAVTRLATSPVDSRLRRVLVSMRCENPSEVATQLPVPARPFFKREQNLRCPSADEDGGRLSIPASSS